MLLTNDVSVCYRLSPDMQNEILIVIHANFLPSIDWFQKQENTEDCFYLWICLETGRNTSLFHGSTCSNESWNNLPSIKSCHQFFKFVGFDKYHHRFYPFFVHPLFHFRRFVDLYINTLTTVSNHSTYIRLTCPPRFFLESRVEYCRETMHAITHYKWHCCDCIRVGESETSGGKWGGGWVGGRDRVFYRICFKLYIYIDGPLNLTFTRHANLKDILKSLGLCSPIPYAF